MGFQRDPGPCKRRRDRTLSLDESGQLSIDFMIGLSIFLITLIIAATMISGLLVGLQSRTIDYDAVAYRTGVILVEDPGEPNAKYNDVPIEADKQWEFIGTDRKDLIKRFGLTLYKSTPRVLRQEKVNNLFEPHRYSISEIRERIIFGSYPYRFNVTLYDIETNKVIGEIGDPYNPDSSYGYIRRVVLVKDESRAVVDMQNPVYRDDIAPGDGIFNVQLNYSELMAINQAPQYWIEPHKENITINMTNISDIANISNISQDARLKEIRIRIDQVDYRLDEIFPELTILIDENAIVPYNVDVQSSINITFPAGMFIQQPINVQNTKMKVSYLFDPKTVNLSQSSTYSYNYGSEGFSPPSLKPAVLEVGVW